MSKTLKQARFKKLLRHTTRMWMGVEKMLQHTVQAQWRDARVLFRESRKSFILFIIIVISGALIFHLFYTFPNTNRHPELDEALHATFALIFFEIVFPFPDQWYLQILFFIIPILGLAAVADGMVHFGSALMNKEERGQKWQVAMASTYHNHVIVCGMGKVGYRVTLELLKFGRDVVGIESNPNGRFVEKALSKGIPIIIADARRTENLRKVGIDRADAIIPCTDNELTNLDIALDAREINPQVKVVMRMFDPDLARRVEKGFGIHTAFSTSALAAPIFAAAAMRVNVKYSFYVNDALLNLSEVEVAEGSWLIGWTVEDLETQLDMSVICYKNKELTDLHPKHDLRLRIGDTILVLASIETLQRLEKLNRAQPSPSENA